MKYIQITAILFLLVLASCDKEENNDLNFIDKTINSIVVDNTNTLWVGTDDGLYKRSGETYKLQNSVSGKVLSLFYVDAKNILWVGTDAGLLKGTINNGDLSVEKIDDANLSNPTVKTIAADGTSKYWFGTEIGFTMNTDNSWKTDSFRVNILGTVFPMDIEETPINSIAIDDSSYYFATEGAALYRAFGYQESVDAFSGATQWGAPYNGLNVTSVMNVVFIDSKGQQWMGGTNGIQVHTGTNPLANSENITYYNDELPGQTVTAIAEAPNGDIWVGTTEGLIVLEGNEWKEVAVTLPDNHVTAIAFDNDGTPWVGTIQGLMEIN